MPNPNQTKPHARIFAEWMLLPSWRMMSGNARALIVELLTSHRPTLPNSIELSSRRAASMLKCRPATAAKAIVELEKCGWLEIVSIGKMTGERCKRVSRYSLTSFSKITGEPPSKAFLYWRPHSQPVTVSTCQNVTTNVSNGHQQRVKTASLDEIKSCELSTLTH